ncbi:MAG: LemA family protein [bacterium]|nr:LemA family protein [bacterium]
MNPLYIVLGIIVLVLAVFIGIYNSLVHRRTRVEEGWSDIEVQMKRRYDLIPNIVEAVKGYVAHEKSVLENVTKARTQAMGAHNPNERVQAENALTGTLKTLFAVAESYPDLKANTNFLDLQRELADTENKLQSARRFFNSVVRDYNIMIQTFPSVMVAGMFGFTKKDFFDLDDEAAREPVKVSF